MTEHDSQKMKLLEEKDKTFIESHSKIRAAIEANPNLLIQSYKDVFGEPIDPRYTLASLLYAADKAGKKLDKEAIDVLVNSLPSGIGVGKGSFNDKLLLFAADSMRFSAIIKLKNKGVSHRECFQAASDWIDDRPDIHWAKGSDATMRRAYYRMINLGKSYRFL